MLCIILDGVSRMDQMDSIFYHSNRMCRMVKWCHAVCHDTVWSQSNESNLSNGSNGLHFFAFEPDMSNGQWCHVVLVHNVVGSQLNNYNKCNHTLTICLLCTLKIYNMLTAFYDLYVSYIFKSC